MQRLMKKLFLFVVILSGGCTDVVETHNIDHDKFVDGPEDDGGVDPVATLQPLFGLPTSYCPVVRSCVTTTISRLNVNKGSDLSEHHPDGLLTGALWFRLQGNGDWWIDRQVSRTQAGYAKACTGGCSDSPNTATLGPTTWTGDKKYRQATVVIDNFVRFRGYYMPQDINDSQWTFRYDLCSGQDVTVTFWGRRSSSDDVQVCWGG